ncbi:MAG: PAS domain S-box protein, partial [Miltoncostaeaceae bacterium]
MNLRRLAPVSLTLVLFVVTMLGAFLTWHYEVSRSDTRASEAAHEGADVLESRMRAAASVLNDEAGLFVASDRVGQDEFAGFARQVLGASGLTSIGWIERVTAAQRPAFEAQTGLTVLERRASVLALAPAATRPVVYPLTHVASLRSPAPTRGTDLGFDPLRRGALERAIESGEVRITGPLFLQSAGFSGVLAFQPAYRGGFRPSTPEARESSLAGVAVGALSFDALLDPLVDTPAGEPRLGVLLGGRSITPGVGAFESDMDAPVAFGGQEFTVVAERPEPSPALPLVILVLGLLVSVLAGVLTSVLARRAARQDRAVREATAALRASRESHRALVENSPDVVSRYDRDLRCVYISPGITATSGRRPTDFLGRTPGEVDLPPGVADLWRGALSDARDGDRDTRFEFSDVAGDAVMHFEARITPEHGPDGDVVSLLATVRDVTELRTIAEELQRARDYSEALVDSMHDGLIVLGQGGVLEHVNQRLLEMTGFTREELVGSRPPFPFHPPEEMDRIRRVLRDYLDVGASGEFELMYRRRDGTRFPVLLGASPLRDTEGTLMGGVRLVRDITETRAAERALRASDERHRGLVAAMA